MRKPSGKVVWKEKTPTVDFPPFIPSPQTSRDLEEAWKTHLHVGALWRLTNNMSQRQSMPSPIPYLMRDLYDFRQGHRIFLKCGSLAIYAGTERCDEVDSSRGHLRILRHTFIVGGGKYIVTDFLNVEPVI